MTTPMPKVGRERDVLVAELLGWERGGTSTYIYNDRSIVDVRPMWRRDGQCREESHIPTYSTNDAHALQALEEWRGQDVKRRAWDMESADGGLDTDWFVGLQEHDGSDEPARSTTARAPTLADAATQALVRTLEEKP